MPLPIPVCEPKAIRASMRCQYPGPPPTASAEASSSNAALIVNNNYNNYTTTINNTTNVTTPPVAPVPFNRQHLEFMHHFSTQTFKKINESPKSAAFYGSIPPLALPWDFATSAMFAVTAAHLATIKPDNKQLYCAAAHRFLSDALRQCRAAPDMLDPKQCGALYIAGLFIGICIMALPGLDQGREADPVTRWVASARAWRGVTIMFSTCTAFGQQAPTASLPPRQSDDGHKKPEPEPFWNTVVPGIKSLIDEGVGTEESQRRRVYIGLWQEIQNVYRSTCIADNSASGVLIRPADNELFYSMIHSGDTIASLLVICMAALQHQFDHLWFVRGMQADAASALIAKIEETGGQRETEIARWAKDWVDRDVTPSGVAMSSPRTPPEDEMI